MVGQTALVERKGGHVGRLLRWLRPMVNSERVSTASRNNSARSIRTPCGRFSFPPEHLVLVHATMADVDQWPGSEQRYLWRQCFLDRKIPRTLSRPSAL